MLILMSDVVDVQHVDSLQMIVEFLVPIFLGDVKLMRVPQLCKNFLNVVLVHAEARQVGLGAYLADEGAVGDVRMS